MSFVRLFIVTLLLVYSFNLCLVAPVNAISHDKLMDVIGGGDDEGLDIDSLVDQQSALIQNLNSALYHINTSYQRMLTALGLQEEADACHATAEAVKSGNLTGKDEIKKVIAATKEAVAAADEKMAEGNVLDAEGKIIFASALPHYGFGSVKMVTTAQAAHEAAHSLQETKDLTVISKLGTLISFGTQAPGLISMFASATGNVVKFAQDNGIDTAKLENQAYDEESLADD